MSHPAGGDDAARGLVVGALTRLEEEPTYRQSSGSELEELARAAAVIGDPVLIWRVRLLQADFDGNSGQLAAAMRQAWKVHEYAAEHGHSLLLARSHLVLAWTHRNFGDFASYLHHAVLAVETLDGEAPDSARGLHVFRLAIALDECGSADQAGLRYAQAEEYAVAAGDIVKQIGCLNNRAYSEYRKGDLVGAAATVHRLADVCDAHDLPMSAEVLDTVARIQLAQGQHAAALTSIDSAITMLGEREATEATALPEFLLTRSTILRQSEQYEDAWTTLKECRGLAGEANLGSVLCRVDEEESALHAAVGNFESALDHFKAFHFAQILLVSDQRAAQAHVRQEILQTEEIRASAEKYYDEANRDHLSNLPNRRYVDKALPTILLHRRVDEVVALALVDVDHFKQVNDEHSHAIGDSVLIRVADLLSEAAASMGSGEARGFAARLGGDEFAIILRGSSAKQMRDCIDTLRLGIAEQVWPVLADGLRISISVGLTWAVEQDSPSTLLQRADALLYRAKRAGRNRVCVDRPSWPPRVPARQS